jgi:molybdate transport system substrate-binding protein
MNRRSAIAGLTSSLVLGLSSRDRALAAGNVVVYAAGSLTEAFQAAGPAFTQKTGIVATCNFGGSDTLATQLTQGAPADVFASANTVQMKVVTAAGLALGAPRVFARNRIVLITPKSNPGGVTGLASLAKPGTKVVLAEPSEPVGVYAREAFAKLSGNGYPADFAAVVERNVVSNEINEKAVAVKIALGEGDAGVVYSTDVTPDLAPHVSVFPFPPGLTPDLTYPIVALKGASNVANARAFVNFVVTDGQAFLKARGFIAP